MNMGNGSSSFENDLDIDWDEPLPEVDCNHTIMIQPTADIQIDGEVITNGDILGVFYTNNQGGLSLGGSTVWNSEVTSIAALGGDGEGFD